MVTTETTILRASHPSRTVDQALDRRLRCRADRAADRSASNMRGQATPTPEGNQDMADRPVFLYAAIYDEIADAEADYEAVFDLHAAGAIGTFDSAVIRKEDDGKVRVTKTEKPTQHGAWTGAGVGALVGILFPPALIGSAIVGAGAGGLTGHLARGISRGDLKELGDELERGQRRRDRARRVEDRGAAREGDRRAPTS